MSLRTCYEEIRSLNLIPDERMDSFDVVKAVDDYRNIWKPKEVKVVLLAESHKHTKDSDFDHPWRYPLANPVYRGEYVRFVYCLANGEKELVRISTNKGTWQYWKLLFSCLNPISGKNDTVPVLKKYTHNLDERMKEKIALLNRLMETGIWLVDASIVGIAGEESEIKSRILQLSWKIHVGPVLSALNPKPKHVVVVGFEVEGALRNEINKLDPKHTVIRQPNARLSGGYPDYPKCFQICSKFLN